jgi:hypothetical protein
MKPTKKDKLLFKEIQSKHNIREGILSMIFKKKLKKALMNDKELQDALRDADKSLDRLKQNVSDLEKKGYSIPSELKKYF